MSAWNLRSLNGLKIPESVTAAEREARSLTHMPFRSWCTVCQRAKGQHQHHKGNQKLTSVIQLDHSFYKVPGETHNLKVLTFVETTTSMSGAVIVPRFVSESGCHHNTQEVHCCQWVHKIRSTSGSLITLFSVNLSSTSRTQASLSHSSAEAELYAMTQAAVDSLAIKALHQGTQISDSFKRSENHSQDRFISRQDSGLTSRHFKEVQNISSSDISGFRTFSVKESCHSKKWELTTIPQIFSRSLFSPQCWAIIFPSSTFSRILH